MAGEITLESFRPLVAETISAILEDFRISESIARQAGTLISRREAKSLKLSNLDGELSVIDV